MNTSVSKWGRFKLVLLEQEKQNLSFCASCNDKKTVRPQMKLLFIYMTAI